MSAGVAAARSSPFSVRQSEQIQQDRAQPLADRPTALEAQAGWRRSKETSAKVGRAEGNRCQPLPPVRVPGGHAHPRPGDHPRVTGCPACSPDSAAQPTTATQRSASGARSGCAALAATRAPGHEPHDDEYGHRDQPDDNKRLERSHDPARSRDGKPYGEDPAKDCPDDPAHVPSMPPDLAGGESGAIIALLFRGRAGPRRRSRYDRRPRRPGRAVTRCRLRPAPPGGQPPGGQPPGGAAGH